MDEKSRKSTQFKLSVINGFKRTSLKRFSNLAKLPKENLVINISKRYTRETKSMLKLKNQLEEIEIIIKKIKVATLCSRATEIFPRYANKNSQFFLISDPLKCPRFETKSLNRLHFLRY